MKKGLLAALLSSVIALTPFAASAEIKEGFYDNFEDYEDGMYATASGINAIYSTGGGRVYIEDNPYVPTMGKSLHTKADSTFFTTQWDMTKTNVIKTYAPYLSISMRIIPEDGATFALFVCGNASKVGDHKEAATKAESVVLIIGGGTLTTGGPRMGLGKLESGKCYDINVIINTKGGEPNTAVYDVYVNGERKTNYALPMMVAKLNATRVNMTGIQFLKMESTNMFIDDLCVRGAEKAEKDELLTMKKFDWTEEVIAERQKAVKIFDMSNTSPNKFVDTAESAYADEIAWLAHMNAVTVPGDNKFRPDDNITRAELSQIAVRLTNTTVYRYKNAFLDVSPDKWYANAIQSAVNAGLVADTIIAKGYYFPESFATVSDVVAYCVCIREKYGRFDEAAPTSGYVDYKGIPEKDRELFGKAIAAGIYEPEGAFLKPNGKVTREMAAHMLYKAVSDL